MGPQGLLRLQPFRWASRSTSRSFSCIAAHASGHNRWSKIKHDKGHADGLKSKARSLLSQEVANASKFGGGPDPSLNSRLAIAIVSAKKGQLSKTSIEAAIAKGQGKSVSGAALENVTVEAMLPHGVAAVIEFQTDQKARVLQEARAKITRKGGTVTPTAYLFEKKGRVWFEKREGVEADDILDQAIEAGALEVDAEDDGRIVVDTDPSEVTAVTQKLVDGFGLRLERTEILFDPKQDTMVTLGDEEGTEVDGIIQLIGDDPSFQNVYLNASA